MMPNTLDTHGLTRESLLDIDYYLRLTRTLEERLVALFRQSKVIGGLYRSLGQEGESLHSSEFGRRPGGQLTGVEHEHGRIELDAPRQLGGLSVDEELLWDVQGDLHGGTDG